MEPVRKAAETAARAIPGVTSATVAVAAHSGTAASAPAAEETLVEKVHEIKVRKFVAVASGKGRCRQIDDRRESAIALRLEGLRVGLLDADVHGPSLQYARRRPPPAAGGDMVRPLENCGVQLMCWGFWCRTTRR